MILAIVMRIEGVKWWERLIAGL